MAKQQDATLSTRGRNTVNELSSVLASDNVPMFAGRIFVEGRTTRAERKLIALNNLHRATQEMRHALRKVNAAD